MAAGSCRTSTPNELASGPMTLPRGEWQLASDVSAMEGAMRFFLAAIMIAGFALASTFVAAEQKYWSEIGTLECTMGPSIGLAMGGRQQAQCTFRSRASTTVETYTGRMERPGLDLLLTGGKLIWIVVSADGLPPQSLFGRYSDVRASTVRTAADASATLCRSSQRMICLQPLAGADHEDGDNFAVGVSAVRLDR